MADPGQVVGGRRVGLGDGPPRADVPATACPAATVILVRPGSSGGVEVFMVRRSASSRFAANAYVFPGGTVSADDMSERVMARTPGLTPAAAHARLAERGGAGWCASGDARAELRSSSRGPARAFRRGGRAAGVRRDGERGERRRGGLLRCPGPGRTGGAPGRTTDVRRHPGAWTPDRGGRAARVLLALDHAERLTAAVRHPLLRGHHAARPDRPPLPDRDDRGGLACPSRGAGAARARRDQNRLRDGRAPQAARGRRVRRPGAALRLPEANSDRPAGVRRAGPRMDRQRGGAVVGGEWLSDRVTRIVAPNPSPMTLSGTNSYVVGEDSVVVVDPGPDLAEHVEALVAAIAA